MQTSETSNRSSIQPNNLLMLILIMLVGTTVGVITMVVSNSLKASVWALNFGTFLALALPVGYLLIKKLNPLQPITIFSLTAIGYVLETAYLINGGQSPTMLDYEVNGQNITYFNEAVLYVFIGVVCHQVAYLVTARWRARLETNPMIPFPNHYSKLRLYVIVAAFSLIGLIGYYLYISSSGGLLFLINNINRRTLLRASDYYRLLFQVMQTASWIWLIYDPRAARKKIFLLLVALNLIGLMTLGSRTNIILYILSLFVLALLKSRQYILTLKRILQFALLGSVLLFMSFVFLAWRNAASIAQYGQTLTVGLVVDTLKQYDQEFLLASTIARANLASIQPLSIFVKIIPEQIPFMSGQSFYWILLTPIPRAIWPDKPVIQLGVYLTQLVDPNAGAGGVPVSWLGELYLNFGVAGIIGGSLLFGYLSGKVYNWFVKENNNPVNILLYGSYLLYFIFFLTKLELNSALVRFLPLVVCILAANYFFRLKVNAEFSPNRKRDFFVRR